MFIHVELDLVKLNLAAFEHVYLLRYNSFQCGTRCYLRWPPGQIKKKEHNTGQVPHSVKTPSTEVT